LIRALLLAGFRAGPHMDAARRWRQDEFLGFGASDAVHLIAIRDAALILAPRGLLSAP
jgi:hypothetical protein